MALPGRDGSGLVPLMGKDRRHAVNKEKKCDIAIVGAAIADLQVYPVSKEITNMASYSAQSMEMKVGGDAINEAFVITRLGHDVRLISCIGDDSTGKFLLGQCEKNGVSTDYIKVDPEKITSLNVGLIWEDGERTFINNKSGSIWTFGPDDLDLSAIDGAKMLCFASIFNNPLLDGKFMVQLFERAKAGGMKIAADIVAAKNGETIDDVREALSYIDYFFPNYDEAAALTGKSDIDEIADVLLECGVKNVILKIGKRGCLVKNSIERFITPAYPKATVVDTTGAGDNFASGFLSCIMEGKSLEEASRFANCTASLAIEKIGATTAIRSRAQADERYADYLRETGLKK